MWVKICGTTTLADAQLAVASGADAIGFVFAPSKRRVNAAQVAAITHALPETIEKVGVFHNADPKEITHIAQECGLTAVQLHFPYDAALVCELGASLGPYVKLLQVLSCPVESLEEPAPHHQLDAAIDDPNLWGILLDASSRGVSGGTGQSFDWKRAAEILATTWPQRTSGQGPKLILAGGLNPENLGGAIAILKPFGVDVVSGVETSPGLKDPARVSAFVHNARQS